MSSDASREILLEEACPSEGSVCRICQSGEEDEASGPLLSPCRCEGSVQWVHSTCLDMWRAKAEDPRRASECELCGTAFLYELREAYLEEVLTLFQRRVGEYTLAALAMLALAFVVIAYGLDWCWSMVVEPTGCMLAIRAIADALDLYNAAAPLVAATGPDYEGLAGARRGRSCGALVAAAKGIVSIARLPRPEAAALCERAAQEDAAAQSREAHLWARLEGVADGRAAAARRAVAAASSQQAGPLLGGGTSAGLPSPPPRHRADVGGSGARCCERVAAWAFSDCQGETVVWNMVMVVFFCGSHLCLGVYWRLLQEALGLRWLSQYARYLALAGASYWVLALILMTACAMMQVPLLAVCCPDGLPVVRDMSPEERLAAASSSCTSCQSPSSTIDPGAWDGSGGRPARAGVEPWPGTALLA